MKFFVVLLFTCAMCFAQVMDTTYVLNESGEKIGLIHERGASPNMSDYDLENPVGEVDLSAVATTDQSSAPNDPASVQSSKGGGAALIVLGTFGLVVGIALVADAAGGPHGDMNFGPFFEGLGGVFIGILGTGFLVGGIAVNSSGSSDIPQDQSPSARLYLAPTVDFARAGAGMNLQLLF